MKKLINILLLAAVMTVAASCVTDEESHEPKRGGAEADVRLRLTTPGGFASSSATRALTYADENTIDNVYVLVFDNDDELIAIKKGEDVSDKSGSMTSPSGIYSGGGEFSITLPPSEGVGAASKTNLVVLVNAEEALDDIGLIDVDDPSYVTSAVGYSYDNVAAMIYPGVESAMYATGDKLIPMWGETGKITIEAGAAPEIALMRAVARVDVGLGDAAIYTSGQSVPYSWDGLDTSNQRIPFELRSVNVVRNNRVTVVIPDADYRTTVSSKPAVSAPTIPAVDARFSANETEAAKFRYNTITGGLYSTQDIYVPEANILRGGTTVGDSNHKERMAIVVGGVFDANTNGNYNDDGAATYYRLDFASGANLMNVLRNRIYQFNIQDVSDKGENTVIEAYEANSTKMTAEVVVWNNGGSGDHEFDGQYYIGTSESLFEFSAEGGTLPIEVDTNYPVIDGPMTNKASPHYGELYSWMFYSVGWSSSDVDWMHFHEVGSPTPLGINYQPTFGTGTTNLDIVVKPNTSNKSRSVRARMKAGNMSKIITVKQAPAAVRSTGSANSGVISYIFHPGYPDHYTLTLTPDDGDDTNGITYVAYFKFGSLLAVSSAATAAGTFLADESTVIQWPEEWAPTRADMEAKFAGSVTGTATATKVPRAGNVYTGYQSSTQFPSLTYPADPLKGVGDPCAYWGEKYGWDGDYRLPTRDESIALTGGTTLPVGVGPNYNWIPPTSGAGTITNLGSGEFPLAPGGSVTLPASGYRLYSGGGSSQGREGRYWMNTNSQTFTFDGTQTITAGTDLSNFVAVRCHNAPFTVAAVAGAGGTAKVTSDVAGNIVIATEAAGYPVTFTATPQSAALVFDGWTSTDITLTAAEKAANPLTITMPANDVTLTATFRSAAATPVDEIEVNGTFWSTTNVAAPGTFAPTAEAYDAGNRYSFDDMDLNAICPTGWRLPTGQEYYDLFAISTNAGTPNGTMTPAGGGVYYGNPGFKTSGGVNGMQVDTPNGSLFFAASGYDDGSNRDQGTGGFYLVSDGAQSNQDYIMYFVQAGVYPAQNFGSTIDKGSIRCVRN